MLLKDCSACYSCDSDGLRNASYLQVDRYAFTAQVVDSQHAADYVSAQIIEYENFPHRLAIFSEQRVDLVLCSSVFASLICRSQVMVQT